MKTIKNFTACLIGTVLTGLCVPVLHAQLPANATIYASGLNGPRGLKFGPDEMLYVAEAGSGGTNVSSSTCQIPAPGGPSYGGLTARVSRIDPSGNRTTVVDKLPSYSNSQPTHDVQGVADIAFLNNNLYALLAGGGCAHGNPLFPNAIIKINPKNGTWKSIVNLSQFFRNHPSAYSDPADFDPEGAPYSIIAHNGELYTVEANHGQVLATDSNGSTRVILDVSLSQGHIVPTSIAARENNLYVGNLGTFPIAQQAERVLTVSKDVLFFDTAPGLENDGLNLGKFKIASSRAGFTTINGMEFGPDGLLYVLELSDGAGYPTGGLGKVVRLKRNGEIEDVVTGLVVPTGMTFGPDRALYISNFGAAPAGAGQILRIPVTLGN
jgi:hypothetical protein